MCVLLAYIHLAVHLLFFSFHLLFLSRSFSQFLSQYASVFASFPPLLSPSLHTVKDDAGRRSSSGKLTWSTTSRFSLKCPLSFVDLLEIAQLSDETSVCSRSCLWLCRFLFGPFHRIGVYVGGKHVRLRCRELPPCFWAGSLDGQITMESFCAMNPMGNNMAGSDVISSTTSGPFATDEWHNSLKVSPDELKALAAKASSCCAAPRGLIMQY